MASEVEDTLKKLSSHAGVLGSLVVNSEGVAIKSTLDAHTTTHYAGLMLQLVEQARAMFKEIDANNELTFLRMRTLKHEIMIAPDKEYMLVVVQNATDI